MRDMLALCTTVAGDVRVAMSMADPRAQWPEKVSLRLLEFPRQLLHCMNTYRNQIV